MNFSTGAHLEWPCRNAAQFDELRAEVERLRADLATWGQMWNDAALLTARVEALRDGTAQV
jgi:hypothetical protein